MITGLSVTNFLNETASNSVTPGGGSVSALAASLGTALISMVCRLAIRKNKDANVQDEIKSILIKSEKLRASFTSIINEDAAAFNKVKSSFDLPKETHEQKALRNASIQEATKGATLIPLRLMELCAEAIEIADDIAMISNQSYISDAGVAVMMISAGCEGAALNVKINLSGIQDSAFVLTNKMKANAILAEVNAAAQQILYRINEKLLS